MILFSYANIARFAIYIYIKYNNIMPTVRIIVYNIMPSGISSYRVPHVTRLYDPIIICVHSSAHYGV